MKNNKTNYLLGILRIAMGWIFLWPFLDKLFGLGYSTCRVAETGVVTYMCEKAWIMGGSPTTGFLQFGTHGPFSSFFQYLAGNVFIDWIFMAGLLFIGLTLILGIGMRLGTYSGVLMLFLMWSALILPEHNPFLDEHVIYAIVLLILFSLKAGQHLGFGNKWKKISLVKRYNILE